MLMLVTLMPVTVSQSLTYFSTNLSQAQQHRQRQ